MRTLKGWALALTVMSCTRPATEGVDAPLVPTSASDASTRYVLPTPPPKPSPEDAGRTPGVVACPPADAGPLPEGCIVVPRFQGILRPLPSNVREAMTGVSWHAGCPVSLEGLVLLDFLYWGFDDRPHRGQMVLAQPVAQSVVEVFKELYELRFPMERVSLVEEYGGSDERSMEANNTSAFNCRLVTGGSTYSRHAYGQAIDINPLINPYVRGSTVMPPAGQAYLSRDPSVKGMITADGPVVSAFQAAGWSWGGDWSGMKDYQHFEKPYVAAQ